MQRLNDALQALGDRITNLGAQIIAHIPELVAAILIILVGWLIGRSLRRVTTALGERVYRRLERADRAPDTDVAPRSSIVLRLVGNIVLLSTVLFFATIAVEVAGLHAAVAWLGRFVQYLPNLLTGLFIIVAGYLLSGVVRVFVSDALASASVSQRVPLARVAQSITIIAAVVVGIDQMGVRVALITTMISIVLAGFLAGLALAFGLGARSLVANLVGAHHARRYIRPGERARIGDFTGEVIELTPTGIVLASDAGRIHVPASRFHDDAMIVSTPDQANG